MANIKACAGAGPAKILSIPHARYYRDTAPAHLPAGFLRHSDRRNPGVRRSVDRYACGIFMARGAADLD